MFMTEYINRLIGKVEVLEISLFRVERETF